MRSRTGFLLLAIGVSCGGGCAEQPPEKASPTREAVNTSENVDAPVGKSTKTRETHEIHGDRHSMWVTATAYCSRPQETQGDPFLAAWGDRLVPGEKCIAVSRDLLDLGLTHRVPVWIEIDGKEVGPYLVLDKMAKRWTDRIDIYYGTDVKAALKWGKRRVRISWPAESSKKP